MEFFCKLAFLIVVTITRTHGQGFGPFRPFGLPGFGRPPLPFGPPPPGILPMPPMPTFPAVPLPPDAGIVAGETGFPGTVSPFPELGSSTNVPSTSFDTLPGAEVQGVSPFGNSVDPFSTTGQALPSGAIQGTTFFENEGSRSLGGTLQIPNPGASTAGEFPSLTMTGDSTRPFPELTLQDGTPGALNGLTTGTSSSDAGVPAGVNPASAAEPSFTTRFGTGIRGSSEDRGRQSMNTRGTNRLTTATNRLTTATDNTLARLVPSTGSQQTILQTNGERNAFDSARILNTVFGSAANTNQQTQGNDNPFTVQNAAQLPAGDDRPRLMPRTTVFQSETFDNSVLRQENPFFGQTSAMPNTDQLGISATQTQPRNVPETNFGTGFPAGSQFPGSGSQLPTDTQSPSATSQRFGGTESMTSSPTVTNGQFRNSQLNSMAGNSISGQFPAGPSVASVNQVQSASNVNSQIPSSSSESRFSMGSSSSQSRFASGSSGIHNQNINSLSTGQGSQVIVGRPEGNLAQTSQNRFEQTSVPSNVNPSQNEFIFTRQTVQPNVLVQSNTQTSPRIVGSATNGFAQFIGSAQRGTEDENSVLISSSINQQDGGSFSQQAAPSMFPNTGFGQTNSISTSMTSVGTVGSDTSFGMSFPTQTFAGGISNQTQVKVIETGQNKIVLSNQLPIQSSNQSVTVLQNNTVCQLSGCSPGEQCVFMDFYPCPIWITTLQCRCLPGCAINNRFIPRGQAITMDTCGNRCSCVNGGGTPSCSTKECPASAK